jgi:hypothetical protein
MAELTEITDTAQDAVLEAVESPKVKPDEPAWHRHVALTTLIMALLAALGSLVAGITANEALLTRTEEIIEISSLEGDRLYMETLKFKHELLTALGETPDAEEVQALTRSQNDMRELESETAYDEETALTAVNTHMVFAIAVTLLSLSITLGGMAVVVERKVLWKVGLVFGAAGAVGVLIGVLTMLS